MSWEDYALARQLLLEERIGTRVREKQQAEAAQLQKAKADLPRG